MAATNREKVARWITGLVTAKVHPSHIKLWHSAGKRAGGPILVIDLADGIKADELAQQLIEAARCDADAQGGEQTYRIVAIRDDDDSAPLSTWSVKIDPGDIGDARGEGGALSGSVIAHVLRNQEAMARINASSIDGILKHYQEALKTAQARITEVEKKLDESQKLHQELLDMKQERDLNLESHKKGENRKDEVLKQLLVFMPGVVGALLGKAGIKVQATQVEAQVRSFVDSLTPEQIEKLAGGFLTPEQVITLHSITETLDTSAADKKEAPGA